MYAIHTQEHTAYTAHDVHNCVPVYLHFRQISFIHYATTYSLLSYAIHQTSEHISERRQHHATENISMWRDDDHDLCSCRLPRPICSCFRASSTLSLSIHIILRLLLYTRFGMPMAKLSPDELARTTRHRPRHRITSTHCDGAIEREHCENAFRL